MTGRHTPFLANTGETPVRLGNPIAEKLPRTYVACLPHPEEGIIRLFAKQIPNDPTWDYRELSASHDPMITDPDAFARLLSDIS